MHIRYRQNILYLWMLSIALNSKDKMYRITFYFKLQHLSSYLVLITEMVIFSIILCVQKSGFPCGALCRNLF